MRLLRKLVAYARVLARGRRNRTDLARWIVRRPQLASAIATYETALVASNRVDSKLKGLAQVRASSLIGCPF